jgi:two-component system LytT family response regulator
MSERKITCLIIDDEQAAVNRLKSLIGQVAPSWNIYGFVSCRELIRFAAQNHASVLFLDVEMPAMTGFELLDKLHSERLNPIPVFVTGFEHYAIKAIKEKAFDYILKPVDVDRKSVV